MATKTMSSSCQSIATAASSVAASSSAAAASTMPTSTATSMGSLIVAACMSSGQQQQQQQQQSHYVNGTGSLGRLKYHHKHKSFDASDEELEYAQLSQSTHILGRYKSERFLASKPDEDRRRRTIIVEKKNDSYGFTLQSYGIHYKRDEEVEMITYVDYVEYGGPAYRSGMREGDVILSINGNDMEKADHKTIVEFIKQCDSRMRMVVLFEDCVRKVELHMRYMQLQSMLQSKMNDLERICLRERELLEGKWKTHSLPARKKGQHSTTPGVGDDGISPTEGDEVPAVSYYRPALSTEDVTHQPPTSVSAGIIPPPAQFTLTYHYLDPMYRYVLRPVVHGSEGDYLDGSNEQQQRFVLQRTESMDTTTASQMTTTQYHSQPHSYTHQSSNNSNNAGTGKPPAPPPRTCEKHKPPAKQQQQQQQQQQPPQPPPKSEKSGSKHCHSGHSCNPCLGHFRWKSTEKAAAAAAAAAAGGGGGDNVSLDAYDLASPCCDSHCVPTRRRHRQHKEHTHKHKHRERERERDTKEQHRSQSRPKSQSQASPNANGGNGGHHHHQQQQPQHQHHHHHNNHNHNHVQQQQQPHSHHHHYHHHQPQAQQSQSQSQSGSIRSRYFDLASGLASHCSLHSCTSSEFAPADSASYTTSISTDTLFWDPKSDAAQSTSRQHSTKSRQSFEQQQKQPTHQQQQQQPPVHQHHHHHQHQQQPQQQQQGGVYQHHHRYHVTATQVQPTTQIYPNTIAYVQKPKSWDNLAAKAMGYGYLDTVACVKPPVKLHIAQQRHSMPRRNPYGRFSTYGDVENYAPPPTEFVGELTTTTTTTITAKSTEELLTACDCLTPQQQQTLKAAQYQLSQNQKLTHQNSCQLGYYSHLPRPTADVGTSTGPNTTIQTANGVGGGGGGGGGGDVATVSEATRL